METRNPRTLGRIGIKEVGGNQIFKNRLSAYAHSKPRGKTFMSLHEHVAVF